MADSIARTPEFAVLVTPEINILTYRYLPEQFRAKAETGTLTAADNTVIDRTNEALQRAQRRAGRNFVSRTKVEVQCEEQPLRVVALRVVLANPLTTEADIDAVLDDQVRIAQAQRLVTAQAG
jgi:glutamate decarboxylase